MAVIDFTRTPPPVPEFTEAERMASRFEMQRLAEELEHISERLIAAGNRWRPDTEEARDAQAFIRAAAERLHEASGYLGDVANPMLTKAVLKIDLQAEPIRTQMLAELGLDTLGNSVIRDLQPELV